MTTNVSGIRSAKSGYSPTSFLDGNGALHINVAVVGWFLVFSVGEDRRSVLMPNLKVGEWHCWWSQVLELIDELGANLFYIHISALVYDFGRMIIAQILLLTLVNLSLPWLKRKIRELPHLLCKSIFTCVLQQVFSSVFQIKHEELKPSFVTPIFK